MKRNARPRGIVTAGLFAALIFVTTYMFHIPTAHGGYVHVGDTMIYLAASLMPLPYAAPAAAIGAALSDALSPGGIVWVIPTLLIKPMMALFFTYRQPKILCRRNVTAIFVAGILGVAGYDVASGIMFHNFIAPLLELPLDIIQPIASGILFAVLGGAFDKMNLKHRFDFTFKA